MKILIIGGGIFVGRAILEAAQLRGHELTVFNRGKSAVAAGGVEQLIGDRDGDLGALRDRAWDAVIDTCGYFPRQVESLRRALGTSRPLYVFISSVSAYQSFAPLGITEEAPLAPPPETEATAVTPQNYGPLKAGCEAAARLFERSLIIRPGIIIGPDDPTGRFTYWVARLGQGGRVLVPGAPTRPVQLIDARDLAAWTLQLVERQVPGVFNAVGPADLTWGAMLAACPAGPGLELAWVADEFIAQHRAEGWDLLPLYLAASLQSHAGLYRIQGAAAAAAGLRHRPLADSTRDVLAWSPTAAAAKAKHPGLEPAREAELLAAWAAR